MDSVFLFGTSAIIFLVITIILSAFVLLINAALKKRKDAFDFRREEPGGGEQENEPIEGQIAKRARIKPDKVVVYGQNTFAIDSRKKKIFIQTYMEPDGIMLEYRDVVSFDISEDDADDEAQCGALTLKIRTRKKGYAEIVLPYITSPVDRSGFAYASASGAAKDVKAVLEGI